MESRHLGVFTGVQIVAMAILVWFLITWKAPWDNQRYVGTVLACVGIFGIGLAPYQLGSSFSITPEAKQLVTHGLYSKIRNPIYVFGVMIFVGFALVLQKPTLWVMLPVIDRGADDPRAS